MKKGRFVLVDPETNMVKLHGCYDVHWPDWVDWIWAQWDWAKEGCSHDQER